MKTKINLVVLIITLFTSTFLQAKENFSEFIRETYSSTGPLFTPLKKDMFIRRTSPNFYWDYTMLNTHSALIYKYINSVDVYPNYKLEGTTTTKPEAVEVPWSSGDYMINFDGYSDALDMSMTIAEAGWMHQSDGAALLWNFIPDSTGSNGNIFDSSRAGVARAGIYALMDTTYERVLFRIMNGDNPNVYSISKYINNVYLDEPNTIAVLHSTANQPNFIGSINGCNYVFEDYDFPVGSGSAYAVPRFGRLAGSGTIMTPFKGSLLGFLGKQKTTNITYNNYNDMQDHFVKDLSPALWYRVDGGTTKRLIAIQGKLNHRIELTRDISKKLNKDIYRITNSFYRDLGLRSDFPSAYEPVMAIGGEWHGTSHGNEKIVSVTLYADGTEISLDVSSASSCTTLQLVQNTQLLSIIDQTPICNKVITHTITKDNYTINTEFTWLSEQVVQKKSYFAMLPFDHWGVNRTIRDGSTEELLTSTSQTPVYSNVCRILGSGTNIDQSLLVKLENVPAIFRNKCFVVTTRTVDPALSAKLYFNSLDDDYTTSTNEYWKISSVYSFEPKNITYNFPLYAGYWTAYYDADYDLNSANAVDVDSLDALISREKLISNTLHKPAIDVADSTVHDYRRFIKFDHPGTVMEANNYAQYFSGNDTDFVVALHIMTPAVITPGETLWSVSAIDDVTHYLKLQYGINTFKFIGRCGGLELTGDTETATIVANTEYVIVLSRSGDTYSIIVNGMEITGNLVLSTVGTLTNMTIGDANFKLRRFAFARSTTTTLGMAKHISTTWLNN